jgi:hypothetical protein
MADHLRDSIENRSVADIIAWSIRRSVMSIAPDNGVERVGLDINGLNLLEVAKAVLRDLDEPPKAVLKSISERIGCNERDARTVWNACIGSMIQSSSPAS